MLEQPTHTEFTQALREVAASRGIESLEELQERLRAAGYTETADSLLQGASGGFGQDLDKVLGLNEEEKVQISDAWARTYLGVRGPVRETEAERSKLFAHIAVDLDYVASLDEQDHGGTIHSRYIRETLIPFCEREGGLKSDAEEWKEHRERQNQEPLLVPGRGILWGAPALCYLTIQPHKIPYRGRGSPPPGMQMPARQVPAHVHLVGHPPMSVGPQGGNTGGDGVNGATGRFFFFFLFLLASAGLATALIPVKAPRPPKRTALMSFSARPRVMVPSASPIASSSKEYSSATSSWL